MLRRCAARLVLLGSAARLGPLAHSAIGVRLVTESARMGHPAAAPNTAAPPRVSPAGGRTIEVEVKAPSMGDSMTHALVAKWHVKPGDFVNQYDPLCDLETEKITVDLTSQHTGRVTKLLCGEGESIQVGSPMLLMEVSAEEAHAKWTRSAKEKKGVAAAAGAGGAPAFSSQSLQRGGGSRAVPAAAMARRGAPELTESRRVITDGRAPVPRERRFGKYKVAQGEKVLVWDLEGKSEVVAGPAQLVLSGHAIEKLRHVTAGLNEYLIVTYVDGRIEHRNGPCEEYPNKAVHASVEVAKAVTLNSNEALVVYRPAEGTSPSDPTKTVDRHILHGPAVYFPHPSEWTHNFLWHGGRQKFRFSKLRTLPDQMPIVVDHVRTADDALVEVKLVIFFELTSIETMLDKTSDPLADFSNSIAADVIRIASKKTFDGLRTASEEFNRLETYSTLVSRAKLAGFEIRRVLFRGFTARPELSMSQESSLMKKTKLNLQLESEEKNQDMADLVLERKHARAVEQLQMRREQTLHEIQMSELQFQSDLTTERDLLALELADMTMENDAFLAHVRKLKDLGVDLTPYLVAHARADGVSVEPRKQSPAPA